MTVCACVFVLQKDIPITGLRTHIITPRKEKMVSWFCRAAASALISWAACCRRGILDHAARAARACVEAVYERSRSRRSPPAWHTGTPLPPPALDSLRRALPPPLTASDVRRLTHSMALSTGLLPCSSFHRFVPSSCGQCGGLTAVHLVRNNLVSRMNRVPFGCSSCGPRMGCS